MAREKRQDRPEAVTDEVEIIQAQLVEVSQTNTLYQPSRVTLDAAQPWQLAIVAAETEAAARSIATSHDPFGKDWMNEAGITCEIVRRAPFYRRRRIRVYSPGSCPVTTVVAFQEMENPAEAGFQ